jgi:hypothetical protein
VITRRYVSSREFITDDDFDRDSAIVTVLARVTDDRLLSKVRLLPNSNSRNDWSKRNGCTWLCRRDTLPLTGTTAPSEVRSQSRLTKAGGGGNILRTEVVWAEQIFSLDQKGRYHGPS